MQAPNGMHGPNKLTATPNDDNNNIFALFENAPTEQADPKENNSSITIQWDPTHVFESIVNYEDPNFFEHLENKYNDIRMIFTTEMNRFNTPFEN